MQKPPELTVSDRLIGGVFLPVMALGVTLCFASFSSAGLSDVFKKLQILLPWQGFIMAALLTLLAWLGFTIGRDQAFGIHSRSDGAQLAGPQPWLTMSMVRGLFFGSVFGLIAVFMLPIAKG